MSGFGCDGTATLGRPEFAGRASERQSAAPSNKPRNASAPGRVGQRRELGWAATLLASRYASYVTGHPMVVDGANWQRRAMLMPEFEPIREQLGKGPFEL